MTKVIIISEGNLDSFYDQTLQYFRDKYGKYPTSLTGKGPSQSAIDDLSYFDSMARNAADAAGRSFNSGKDIA